MTKTKLNYFRITILILIIVIIGGASFAGWYIWQKNKPVESQQTNSKITRYKGLNILQTDWSSWPGATSEETINHHYSSLQEGQLVDGGFIVDEVSNDYIKLSIGGASYDGPFEESEIYNDPNIQLKIILKNGVAKEFKGLTADAGTNYSLLYIK